MGDGTGPLVGVTTARPQELLHQCPRLLRRKGLQTYLAPFRCPSRTGANFPKRFQARAGGRILTAIGTDQTQNRRIGRPNQVGKKRRAVGVSPLEVVNIEDQSSALA